MMFQNVKAEGFSIEDEERMFIEYELIKEKKSKLPANERRKIIEIVDGWKRD